MAKTFEQWAEEKKTADWLAAATKAAKGWAIGKELEEADFDAAVSATGDFRYHSNPPTPEQLEQAKKAPAAEPATQPVSDDWPVIIDRK